MNFKSSLILLVCLTFSINTFGQGFKEGYLLKTVGDTLTGFIRYNPDKNEGLWLEYKTENDQSAERYSVSEVFGFGIGSYEHYQKLDLTSVEGIATFYFSRILVLGERMSLYKIPQGHLVVKRGSAPGYLANKKTATNEQDVIRQNTRTLGAYITDCSEPLFEKANGKFNQASLVEISIAYNECLGSTYEVLYYDTTQPKISFEPFVFLGMLSSTPDLKGAILSEVAGATYKSTLSLTLGLGTVIRSPRFSTNTGFIIGAEYKHSDYYGYERGGPSLGANNIDVSINTGILRGILGLDFNKKLKTSSLFLQFGLSTNHFLNTGTQVVIDDIRPGPDNNLEIVRSESSPQLVSQDAYIGIWINAGIRKSLNPKLKLGLSLSYERLPADESFYADFNNFQLSVILSR